MEVGKSAFHIETADNSIMLDCGMMIDDPPVYPDIPQKVDALALSHCHLDHSGSVPILHKKTSAPIYATDLTFELSRLLHNDSHKINKLKGYEQKYSEDDLDRMQRSEIALNYNSPRRIGKNAHLELLSAGHIPGAAGIVLELDGRRLFYTGDINTSDTRLVGAGEIPEAEILIIESTYGNRNHPPRQETERRFIERIRTTLVGGGVALVPAFGVGRTQEMLLLLADIGYPVYLDGMGRTVTTIMLDYPEYLKDADALQDAAQNAMWIRKNRQRAEIIKEPCVIITTAGMLTGGPIVQYIQRLSKNKKATITLTGYQVEGTNGRLLMEQGYIIDELKGRKINVQIDVEQFDFSAHSDHDELLEIVKTVKPEKIALIHGDRQAIDALVADLSSEYKVYTPEIGTTVEIK